jgi:hypothetical protein
MAYLTGTEVSVTFAGETVHVLGLGFDADDADLVAGLAATRGGRLERAREMAEGLARAGIPGAFDGALRLRRATRSGVAHALRALPGRPRPLRRHARGLPPLPGRRQARLRAAPLGRLGDAVRWITAPAAWPWWRTRRAAASRRPRSTRCSASSWPTAGAASR